MAKNIFCYGTLTVKDFYSKILIKDYKTCKYTLKGYSKAVDDSGFLTLIKDPTSSVKGLIFLNINDEDFSRLNRWENYPTMYRIETKTISVNDSEIDIIFYLKNTVEGTLKRVSDDCLYTASNEQILYEINKEFND